MLSTIIRQEKLAAIRLAFVDGSATQLDGCHHSTTPSHFSSPARGKKCNVPYDDNIGEGKSPNLLFEWKRCASADASFV
jgi:hypothetical protein